MGGLFGKKTRPWYADGLQFECLQCGRCCGGAPGYVFINAAEIDAVSEFMKMSADDFMARFVRRTRRGTSLTECATGDCVMLDGGRCQIYRLRPAQCRTWPFWPSNLTSRRTWLKVARRCPGVGAGPVHHLEEIEQRQRVLKL